MSPKARVFQHPTALVETEAIGTGTRIWAFAHVMRGARVGRDCVIGDHSFIESGVRIGRGVTIKNGVSLWEGVEVGDHAFLGPNAVFTNDLRPRSRRLPAAAGRYRTTRWLQKTRIGTGATVGANATVLCGIRIGRFAMIAAGCVVTTDVPDHALWAGVPGRFHDHVCRCGSTLVFVTGRAACRDCGLAYREHGGRVRIVG